jgi:hypothetical protein
MRRVIQGRLCRINIVLQRRIGRPQQRYCAGNMGSGHGRAAGGRVSVISAVVA